VTAVLFDLDGTLLTLGVDIEPVREALSAMFAERGYRAELRPILSRLDEAASQVASSDEERLELIARGRAHIDEAEVAAAATASACDGAAALLAALRSRNVATGIVTDNGRACLGRALEAAGLGAPGDFDVVVTRDDVERAKPAPDGVVTAARALASEQAAVLFVGDSRRDMAAGRGARGVLGERLRVVAVTAGRKDAEELVAEGADDVVATLGDVLELVA